MLPPSTPARHHSASRCCASCCGLAGAPATRSTTCCRWPSRWRAHSRVASPCPENEPTPPATASCPDRVSARCHRQASAAAASAANAARRWRHPNTPRRATGRTPPPAARCSALPKTVRPGFRSRRPCHRAGHRSAAVRRQPTARSIATIAAATPCAGQCGSQPSAPPGCWARRHRHRYRRSNRRCRPNFGQKPAA